MSPTAGLLEMLEKEDLEQARQMSGSDKLRAGGDLFDEACRCTLAGICQDHPDISEEAAMDELRRRLSVDQASDNPRIIPVLVAK